MIIPSIDLSNGKVVQLQQGKNKVIERDDPLQLAEQFSRFGEIAVIDIDAAKQQGENRDLIKQLCRRYDCRVGGGIRNVEQAEAFIQQGAVKIIVGTAAFTGVGVNEPFLSALAKRIGKNRIIIALDHIKGKVVTDGWQQETGIEFRQVIKQLEKYAGEFLFTCVEKEGMLQGTDLEAVGQLRSLSDIPVTVAGGVNSLEEVTRISAMNCHIQLGMALYQNIFSLEESFIASLDFNKGLLPTIVQDASGQVLMLAYSSRESLQKMFKSERGTYYSRSRKNIWVKGETSGNIQQFRKIRMDCDRDALLMTVSQKGVACHTESYSCFGDRQFRPETLQQIVKQRLQTAAPDSYTASLNQTALAGKIMEEAQELIEAETEAEVIWEAADLFYFMTVLLSRKNISFELVFRELDRRNKTKDKR